MTSTWLTRSRFWAVLVLLLAAVLALTGAAGAASAAVGSANENRVKGLNAVPVNAVGPAGEITAGQQWGEGVPHHDLAEGRGVHTYYVMAGETGTAVLVHNCGGRAASNPAIGRYDLEHGSFDDAVRSAHKNAGDLGDQVEEMYDPVTGTLIGQRSVGGQRGWRIDDDHLNWWDWSAGKKGAGGRYGHEFFPAEQAGPHSEYRGYAPWQRRP